jgi:hypothetical protein
MSLQPNQKFHFRGALKEDGLNTIITKPNKHGTKRILFGVTPNQNPVEIRLNVYIF